MSISETSSPKSPDGAENRYWQGNEGITQKTLNDINIVNSNPKYAGVNAEVIYPEVKAYVDNDEALKVLGAITELEERYPENGIADYLLDPEIHPVAAAWGSLSKRAIALSCLYEPDQTTLGGRATIDAYSEPLFDGQSAADILYAEKPEKAKKILDSYDKYINTVIRDPNDRNDEFGLNTANYIPSVPDSLAVRLRAAAAGDEIINYATENRDRIGRDGGLKIASLACGAAGPIFNLLPRIEESGVGIRQTQLVDWDVMALATAYSHAEKEDLLEHTDIQRSNLLKDDLRKYLHDADVVDLLGLFEYFPETVGKAGFNYKMASNFMRQVGKSMKPGGMIVFGNMLDDRRHQPMFDQIWPDLHQRSIQDVLRLTNEAGFPNQLVSAKVPDDGVYGIYTIRIPEEGLSLPDASRRQRMAQWVMTKFVKEY